MCGHGGNLGHVNSIISINFHFHESKRLHTKFVKNGPMVSDKNMY